MDSTASNDAKNLEKCREVLVAGYYRGFIEWIFCARDIEQANIFSLPLNLAHHSIIKHVISEPNWKNINMMSVCRIYLCHWQEWEYSAHIHMSVLDSVLHFKCNLKFLDNTKSPQYIQTRHLIGKSVTTHLGITFVTDLLGHQLTPEVLVSSFTKRPKMSVTSWG